MQIHWTEKLVAVIASGLLLSFLAALIAGYYFYDLDVADCVTDVPLFSKGEVHQIFDPTNYRSKYEVKVVAKMWTFDPPVIEVVAGSDIDFYLTSTDVIHGVIIQGTNVNLMAVPGVVNFARLSFDQPGEYSFLCHEYCGSGHQSMAGKFVVKSNEGVYRPGDIATAPVAISSAALAGRALLDKNGCLACHSLDGTPILAPTFKGIFGRTQSLSDGSNIVIDEAYLKDSILHPTAKMVKGYQPLMPQMNIPESDLQAIVDYLKSMKVGTP